MRNLSKAVLFWVAVASVGLLMGCQHEEAVKVEKPPAQLAEDQIKAIENNPNLPEDAKRAQINLIQQNQMRAQYKGAPKGSGPVTKP